MVSRRRDAGKVRSVRLSGAWDAENRRRAAGCAVQTLVRGHPQTARRPIEADDTGEGKSGRSDQRGGKDWVRKRRKRRASRLGGLHSVPKRRRMGKSDREVRAGGHKGRAGRGRRNAHHRRKRKLVHRAGGHGKAVQRRAGGRCKRCTGVLGSIKLVDGASGGDHDRSGRQCLRREARVRQAHLRQQAVLLQQCRLRRSILRLHRRGRAV